MEKQTHEPPFLEHACIATRMLDKRRQLYDVKEILIAQKEEYEKICQLLQQKEEELASKDLKFQQSLAKFELFSKENESKQLRAAKRFADEVKLCESKHEEVQKLSKLLEETRAEGERLAQLVDKKKKYRDYLAESASHLYLGANKFSDLFDILNRYDLLKQTSERTRQRWENIEKEVAKQREEYERLQTEKENSVYKRNKELYSLQKELEARRAESAKLQNQLDEQMNNKTDNTSDLGRMHIAVNNIVERFESQANDGNKRAKDRRRGPSSTVDDREVGVSEKSYAPEAVLKGMETIAEFMSDYRQIVSEWEEQAAP